jgi:hypothetical protein
VQQVQSSTSPNTIIELTEQCRERGIAIRGTKEQRMQRITNYDNLPVLTEEEIDKLSKKQARKECGLRGLPQHGRNKDELIEQLKEWSRRESQRRQHQILKFKI